MLLFVAVLEVYFGNRRELPLEFGGEEPFVKDDILHGVAVEYGQHQVEVPRVVYGHAVEQKLVLVVSASVDQKVVAGGYAGHARQNPDLRKEVVAVEREHARRSQFVERVAQFARIHGDLFDFEELGIELGLQGQVAVDDNRLFIRLVSHAGDAESVTPFGQRQSESAVFVGEGVLFPFVFVVKRDDGSVELFAASLFADGTREGEELLFAYLDNQFAG